MQFVVAIAFILLSLALAQEFDNQLASNGQQLGQMFNPNHEVRAAAPVNEKSAQGQTVQAFVLSGSQHHPQQQEEKVIVQVGNPQHEHIFVQAGHQQPHHVQPHHQQQQIIKVVEVEQPHKKPEIVVPEQGKCHLLGRKGECVTVPRYFNCIVNGGILFMSFTECGFNTGVGCCVKNVIPFLSQSA